MDEQKRWDSTEVGAGSPGLGRTNLESHTAGYGSECPSCNGFLYDLELPLSYFMTFFKNLLSKQLGR